MHLLPTRGRPDLVLLRDRKRARDKAGRLRSGKPGGMDRGDHGRADSGVMMSPMRKAEPEWERFQLQEIDVLPAPVGEVSSSLPCKAVSAGCDQQPSGS